MKGKDRNETRCPQFAADAHHACCSDSEEVTMGIESTRLRRIARWGLCLAVVVATLGAYAVTAHSHRAGDIVMETRSAKMTSGETVQYEIGTLFVPENRAATHSRLIGVGF